eukprot:TRINITY_DN9434_c0_g1_i1.p1 TRINITY_DN9434_c0_g1~~TRINITY_DN9434_c0_g1_i1.p1  ORF type:complete len:460 (-),score=57.98 TRINITY_DN9434_c0_g1_i1:30-1253(-)
MKSKLQRSATTGCSVGAVVAPIVFALSVAVVLTVLPGLVDRALNRVEVPASGLGTVSEDAMDLYKKSWIVDMHADTLLWPSRDITQKSDAGHVDIPRLLEASVALQAFTIVTAVPAGQNIERNNAPSALTDTLTFKTIAEGWGYKSITSRAERTLFQARRLYDVAARLRNDTLFVIESASQLRDYMKLRESRGNTVTAGFLGIEGLHALDGDLANVDVFFNAGIRMMGPAHFFDNEVGGSAHGAVKGGLTPFGRSVIRRMEELNVIVDLAHASASVIDDVLGMATRPVVISHTGVRGVCNNTRNLSDKHIRGIAKTGGLVSIAYFKPAICGDDPLASIVQSIQYVADLVGIEYVALGSDFDGAVATPFDTTGLPHITQALLDLGFSKRDIQSVMGENARTVLLKALP